MVLEEILILTLIMEEIIEDMFNMVEASFKEDNFQQLEEEELIHHMFQYKEDLCIILVMAQVETST